MSLVVAQMEEYLDAGAVEEIINLAIDLLR